MATVSGTGSSTGSPSTTSGTAADRKMLASNFDTFLTLLTTQLKNQNPLDPMDANQFTQQLVQFASVEQLIKSNDTLTSLLSSSKASAATNAASFVGMQITADGASSQLTGGSAGWQLSAPRAAQATISIKNAQGETVYSESKALSAGAQTFTWNGKTSSGSPAPDGTYTIAVTAGDANGQAVTISTEMSGIVDAVDLTGSVPILKVGSASVGIDKVKTMRKPAA